MRSSFKIPCGIEHLKDLRDFLGKALTKFDFGAVDRSAMILAVDEVCANIILHSKCSSEDFITINVLYERESLIFEIIDNSPNSFDITNYDEPEIQDIIKTKRKGGVGLMLVKRIMDSIEFDKSKGRNICRMYKSLR